MAKASKKKTNRRRRRNQGDDRDIAASTVGELRSALTSLPDDYKVVIGVNDDEFNAAGGIFQDLEEIYVRPDEKHVQLNIWIDIKGEESVVTGDYERSYGPRRNPKGGRRARNTHDPFHSAILFQTAVRRSDRDLTRAAEAMQSGQPQRSLELLLDVAYHLGRASCHRQYADVSGAGVSNTPQEYRDAMGRYTDMVRGRNSWASTFVKRK